nr:MAG TPA: Proteasome subunit A N-terminal signature [Caudoviricetes sp.]
MLSIWFTISSSIKKSSSRDSRVENIREFSKNIVHTAYCRSMNIVCNGNKIWQCEYAKGAKNKNADTCKIFSPYY